MTWAQASHVKDTNGGGTKARRPCGWLGWPTSSEGKSGAAGHRGQNRARKAWDPDLSWPRGAAGLSLDVPSAQSCSGQAASELGPHPGHQGLCFLGLWLRSSRAGTVPLSWGSARAPQLGSRSLHRAGASGQSLPSATGARAGVGTLAEPAAGGRADGEERGIGSHQRGLRRKAAVSWSMRCRARPPVSLPLDAGKKSRAQACGVREAARPVRHVLSC